MADPTRGAAALSATRDTLHRVATHVLARRRYEVTGRFGLRVSPGGIATPAFGDGPEVVRVSGGHLVHETGGGATLVPLEGSTLASLASAVGAHLDMPFHAGEDTPDLGDPDEPLALDHDVLDRLAGWYAFAARVLDEILAGAPAGAAPATVQLWPEHFDLGTHLAASDSSRVNLGASPGDAFSPDPYLYVGPWDSERPGGEEYWNAPFGAVLDATTLAACDDARRAGLDFFARGLELLAG